MSNSTARPFLLILFISSIFFPFFFLVLCVVWFFFSSPIWCSLFREILYFRLSPSRRRPIRHMCNPPTYSFFFFLSPHCVASATSLSFVIFVTLLFVGDVVFVLFSRRERKKGGSFLASWVEKASDSDTHSLFPHTQTHACICFLECTQSKPADALSRTRPRNAHTHTVVFYVGRQTRGRCSTSRSHIYFLFTYIFFLFSIHLFSQLGTSLCYIG